MYSGNLCLELSNCIGWNEFPGYVSDLLKYLDGRVTERCDAVDMRVWKIQVDSQDVRVVYEDYPQMVSIESTCDSANVIIEKIFEKLKGP